MSFAVSLLLPLLVLFPATIFASHVAVSDFEGRLQCTVTASEDGGNDVPGIMEAFDTCGTSGDIIFPEDEQFNILERVHITGTDVQIEWRGEWLMSDNLSYWRSNSYPIAFQNHRAGIIFSGNGIRINGYGTGGVNGNGDTWYSAEAGETQEGRPMPFVLWNVSDVSVEDFYINQPPLWALNIMNGTDLTFRNIVCNATSSEAPSGYNWVQNTDGFDTMDVRNVTLTNFVYQGGDDCIAIKPRSYDVTIQNVTCNGGNGVAIGSVGQYEEDNSVDNVVIDTVKIVSSNVKARFTAYIKTWIGALVPQDSYESAGEPRGGGWGNVTNIIFSNFDIDGASVAPLIDQNSGDNGSYSGTSKMQVRDVTFVNFTGVLSSSNNVASLSCSENLPCDGIVFEGMDLKSSDNDSMTAKCKYVVEDTFKGLSGCT